MIRRVAHLRGDALIDRKVSLIIALQVTLLGVKNVLVQGFPFLYEINTKLNILNLSIVTILYLYAFKLLSYRCLCKNAVIFNIFIILSIFFTIVVFPQNTIYLLDISLRWLVVCFITGFMVSKLRSFVWLQKYMLLSSYILTISCIAFYVIVSMLGQIASNETTNYSLSMSYVALWASMWQLHAFFKKGDKMALLSACITIGIIVMYGSRNPLIAIVAYIIIQIFDKSRDKSNFYKMFLHILLILIGVMFIFWKQVVVQVNSFFEYYGLNSRTVGAIYEATEGNADITSGRNDIHEDLIKLIFDHPVLGMGIGGDVINNHELAHSLYLSVFSTYGIFIGTLFMLFFIRHCFLALKKSLELNHQILVLFMCMVLPRGFTGGDMWESDIFWWLLGVMFMIITTKNIERNGNVCNYVKEGYCSNKS